MLQFKFRLRAFFARAFLADISASISVVFAVSAVMIVIGVGAAIDLTRAYQARQKLSEAATLTCQYASRPSVIDTSASSYSGTSGGTTYSGAVKAYLTSTLQALHFQYTQSTTTPFTYTQNGPANVSLSANVPTSFMQIVKVSQIPVTAASHCYDNAANIIQRVANGSSSMSAQEGFENSTCSGSCFTFYSPTGTTGTVSTPVSTPSSTIGYSGSGGAQWVIMGYCLEIDSVGIIESSVPQGTHSAELDCDNGSGSAGNSSISTQIYLPAGNYDLRWNYVSRIDYPDYDPAYICGSAASDLSWANDTNASDGAASNALRTNQLNVYLDLNTSGVPPTHTTMVGSQTLGGSNLIDMCVYAQNWIERSIRVKVTTPGYYWLSFAADGQNDSYGGQLDNIRLCQETCTTSLQDNFPSAWVTSTNLFEDTFESPIYSYSTSGSSAYISTSGNMNNSDGTSGAAGSGWPNLAANGWGAAPYNQINYVMKSPYQGSQAVEVAGTKSGSMTTSQRLISNGFLLDPGYYQVSYHYISDGAFSSLSGVYCGSTPSAANITSLSGSATAKSRATASATTVSRTSNIVGIFMSHALEASTPNSGGSLNSATSYTNPNGTTSTTPTVAPDGISLTNYNSSQVNPLLDICGYATTWQTRSANILITKPAFYWLTASALGTPTADYAGAIDDVKLTALGSPYMSSPPSTYVTIPVPSPQPGGTTNYTGFFIIADPLTPPAPLQ